MIGRAPVAGKSATPAIATRQSAAVTGPAAGIAFALSMPQQSGIARRRRGGDRSECSVAPAARCHASPLWAQQGGRANGDVSHLSTRPKRQRGRPSLPFALHSRSEPRACSGTHFRTGVASIAAAPGGDRCERASENDRLGPLDTHRPPSFQLRPGKRVDVWHPTSAVARRTALSLRAASVQWHPFQNGGGIDRRRSGRRSMRTCK